MGLVGWEEGVGGGESKLDRRLQTYERKTYFYLVSNEISESLPTTKKGRNKRDASRELGSGTRKNKHNTHRGTVVTQW